MTFTSTPIHGLFEVSMQLHADERGHFARSWCKREFEENGLDPRLVQCSVSFNRRRATLRGMHFQVEPYPESKLVRCSRGAIFDVALDLRPTSSTYCHWFGAELTADNYKALFIPPGCAHGFISLEDSTEVYYQMSEFFHPDLSQGVRWNDPAFSIQWPLEPVVMAERDRTYPDFVPEK